MQKTDFEVRPDKKRLMLGGRVLFRVEGAVLDVMEESATGEQVLLQEYKDLPLLQIDATRQAVIRKFFPDLTDDQLLPDMDNLETQILDEINGKRELKGILYPYCYAVKPSRGIEETVYTINELPKQFLEKYHRIDEAVQLSEFPLRARVLAALNLSDTMVGIQEKFHGLLWSMSPEFVYVNIESGEIKILIERCIDPMSRGKDRYVYGFVSAPGEDEKKAPLEEADLLNFLEYTTFRLLCMEDPFDGKETLVRYPYLTRKALEEIHKGEYSFAFANAEHPDAALTAPNAWARWKNLPGSLRRLFERIFNRQVPADEKELNLTKWRKQMRKLRDCLVCVNRQFRLCDPEISNKVLFMLIGEYQIPVWSNKAAYWYHAGLPYEATRNGLVGGIDAEGFLENRTDSRWVVEIDKKTVTVAPDGKLKLEEGMKLTVAEQAVIEVVSGEKPLPVLDALSADTDGTPPVMDDGDRT